MEMLDGHVDEFIYCFHRKVEGKIFDLILVNILSIVRQITKVYNCYLLLRI